METMANLFQSDKAFGGNAQIKRRIANDMQGYIAEMLAKAVNQNALNSGARPRRIATICCVS